MPPASSRGSRVVRGSWKILLILGVHLLFLVLFQRWNAPSSPISQGEPLPFRVTPQPLIAATEPPNERAIGRDKERASTRAPVVDRPRASKERRMPAAASTIPRAAASSAASLKDSTPPGSASTPGSSPQLSSSEANSVGFSARWNDRAGSDVDRPRASRERRMPAAASTIPRAAASSAAPPKDSTQLPSSESNSVGFSARWNDRAGSDVARPRASRERRMSAAAPTIAHAAASSAALPKDSTPPGSASIPGSSPRLSSSEANSAGFSARWNDRAGSDVNRPRASRERRMPAAAPTILRAAASSAALPKDSTPPGSASAPGSPSQLSSSEANSAGFSARWNDRAGSDVARPRASRERRMPAAAPTIIRSTASSAAPSKDSTPPGPTSIPGSPPRLSSSKANSAGFSAHWNDRAGSDQALATIPISRTKQLWSDWQGTTEAMAIQVATERSPAGDRGGYKPRELSGLRPQYPQEARREGASGAVSLRLHVDANGKVHAVDVLDVSGHAAFAPAALAVARQWRFVPPPAPFVARKRVEFRIRP